MWSPCPRALCRNTHPPLAKKMNILSHRWWEACIAIIIMAILLLRLLLLLLLLLFL